MAAHGHAGQRCRSPALPLHAIALLLQLVRGQAAPSSAVEDSGEVSCAAPAANRGASLLQNIGGKGLIGVDTEPSMEIKGAANFTTKRASANQLIKAIGVQVLGSPMLTLFPAGTEVPALKQTVLTTPVDNQEDMHLTILENDATALGTLRLSELPMAARHQPRIRLFVEIQDDGSISASAEPLHDRLVTSERFALKAQVQAASVQPIASIGSPLVRFTGKSYSDSASQIVRYEDAPLPEEDFMAFKTRGRAQATLLSRSAWQKTFRCVSDEPETCQECWGTPDCWTSGNLCGDSGGLDLPNCDVRVVFASASGGWSRFQNVIHVSSPTEKVQLKLTVRRLQHGSLHVYWDSDEVHNGSYGLYSGQAASPLSTADLAGTFGKTISATLPAGAKGGHKLTLEYVVDPHTVSPGGEEPAVEIEHLDLWMDQDFATCEDSGACLSILAQDLELRNDNVAQYNCLHAPVPTGTCAAWRYCLEQVKWGNARNHTESLLTWMSAAGVGPPQPLIRIASPSNDSIYKEDEDQYDEPLCMLAGEASRVISGGEDTDWVSSTELQDLLSATTESVEAFWTALGLSTANPEGSGFKIRNDELCKTVVNRVKSVGVCPPAVDLACVTVGQESACVTDVSPAKLEKLGPKKDQDLPDFHDKAFLEPIIMNESEPINLSKQHSLLEFGDKSIYEAAASFARTEHVDYSVWELTKRVANLFRLYPADRPMNSNASLDVNLTMRAVDWTDAEEAKHQQKTAESIAYVSFAIRAFNLRKTETQITKWFGSSAYTSKPARDEVLRVMNSIDHMISNVEPVYEGPMCQPNVYAYVYPRAYACYDPSELKTRPCSPYRGKYVFYLCALYLKREHEMVETLVHEGSHHATAYTDDVAFQGGTAYGRHVCENLARLEPQNALQNADNFCYYIQDVASQVAEEDLQPLTTLPPKTFESKPVCMNPRMEDLVSWDCDCYGQMAATCAQLGLTALDSCFRGMMCWKDNVCGPWKEQMCQHMDSSLRAHIEGPAALLSRHDATIRDMHTLSGGSLDASARSKRCG